MQDSQYPDRSKKRPEEYYWLWVLCVLGLDYFSTLAYQPSITYRETQLLGPLATAVVVFMTLFGALPIYCYMAGRSPGGQGSLGMLDKLLRGWRGKTAVLVVLGFAATDFTMLKSVSLADASVHVLNKQDMDRHDNVQHVAGWLRECAVDYCGESAGPYCNAQLVVTIVLGIVGTVCWFLLRKGFNRNVLLLAVPLVGLYLLMTGVLIGGGLWHMYQQPEIVTDWLTQLQYAEPRVPIMPGLSGWTQAFFFSLLALPNLALGLSGFELSMILMPQVRGKEGEQPPVTRVRNTRKVLIVAAVTMSVYLLGSVLVTTLLIPPEQFKQHGDADNRALAYLAHGGKLTVGEEPLLPLCGIVFGTAYDIVTIFLLCMAGTSVMTALSVLLPQFLLRFGMDFRWSQKWGVLLIAFASINTVITIWFHANVDDQRGAYATGVLVLIACGAVVTLLDRRRQKKKEQQPTQGWSLLAFLDVSFHFLIALVFVATMLAVAMQSPSGLGISLCFVAAILAMSIASRAMRADELRTIGFTFKDEQSKVLWENLRRADFPILLPARPGKIKHEDRELQIRSEHQLAPDAEIVFLEVCIDDPSDFFQHLLIEVVREHNRFVIRVTNGVSLPHAIAAVALEMSRYSQPPSVHFGWPDLDVFSASWGYLAFGEGNIAWKVRELIHLAENDPKKRPRVVVG